MNFNIETNINKTETEGKGAGHDHLKNDTASSTKMAKDSTPSRP